MGRILPGSALFLVLFLFLPPLCGRDTHLDSLQIKGHVRSITGEPLAGVPIRVRPLDASTVQEEISDADGAFQAELAVGKTPDGWVLVEATFEGYAEASEPIRVNGKAHSLQVDLFLRNLREEPNQPKLDFLQRAVVKPLVRSALQRNVPLEGRDNFKEGLRIWRKDKLPGQAARKFLHAAAQAPEFAEARGLAALALMRAGGWSAAGSALEAALQPEAQLAEILIVKGVWENFRHRKESALKTLTEFVAREPKNWLGSLELARALLLHQSWEEADRYLEESLKLGAPKAEVFYLRARALEGKGDYHAALTNIYRLRKKVKKSRMPPGVVQLAARLEEAVSGLTTHKIIPFLEVPLPQIQQVVPYLKGLRQPRTQTELGKILRCSGNRVKAFFRDYPNTTATETFRQSLFNKTGKVKSSRVEVFTYMMIVNPNQGNPYVEELRGDPEGNLRHQGGLREGFMVTKGFPASMIVLHPKQQSTLDYQHLGTLVENGRQVEVMAFAEKPNKKSNLASFRLQLTRLVPLRLQGIAWIDSETCRIKRIRTELFKPYPEVHLTRRTNEVEYGEVMFQGAKYPLWLPQKAVVAVDWAGRTLRNEHTFSDYQLFQVRTEETPIRVGSNR